MWGHLKWTALQRNAVFWNVIAFERNMPIYHHYLVLFQFMNLEEEGDTALQNIRNQSPSTQHYISEDCNP
jgi:hypothetical protein